LHQDDRLRQIHHDHPFDVDLEGSLPLLPVIRVTRQVELAAPASQETHPADPCALGAFWLMAGTRWRYDWNSQASCHAGVLADNPTPVGSATRLL
jgi:hypothetical protein